MKLEDALAEGMKLEEKRKLVSESEIENALAEGARMAYKICPLKPTECRKERCAWYDMEGRDCAVLQIAREIKR